MKFDVVGANNISMSGFSRMCAGEGPVVRLRFPSEHNTSNLVPGNPPRPLNFGRSSYLMLKVHSVKFILVKLSIDPAKLQKRKSRCAGNTLKLEK